MAPLGAESYSQTFKPYYDMSKFFPFSDITSIQNFFQILAYQTILVKPCYNCFMGRNYFSKHGGPYFINDGFSQHTHSHEDPHDIKPDRALLLSLLVAVPIVLITLYALVLSF